MLCLLEALVWCDRIYLQNHPDTPLIYQSGIEYKMPEQFERAELPEVALVRKYLIDKRAPADVSEAFKSVANQVGSGEHFREIPRIIEHGGGDCDNVASWRVAELRELGIAAKPYITMRRALTGHVIYHVIVLWPDGTSEDPSLLLGMGGASRAADRAEEERKLGERTADFVTGMIRTRQVDRTIDEVFGGGASSEQLERWRDELSHVFRRAA